MGACDGDLPEWMGVLLWEIGLGVEEGVQGNEGIGGKGM